MSFIKKATEIEVAPVYKFLIYGAPGTGKTTIAHSAPHPVLFDFDAGVLGVNAAFLSDAVQIKSVRDPQNPKRFVQYGYDIAKAALEEVCADPEYKTIIVDTVSRLRDYQTERILADNPKMGKVDQNRELTGELTLQGYGALKMEFNKFMKKCTTSGKHVICLAHEQGEIVKRAGNEIKSFTPKISQGALADLTAEFDFIGYMYNDGDKRFLSFTPTETYYAKNRCGLQKPMAIPCIVNDMQQVIGKNDFLTRFIESATNYYRSQMDLRRKYDMLMARIKELVDGVKTADEANDLLGKFSKAEPVWDSHIAAKQLLDDRMASVGVKFNANTNRYEAAA